MTNVKSMMYDCLKTYVLRFSIYVHAPNSMTLKTQLTVINYANSSCPMNSCYG